MSDDKNHDIIVNSFTEESAKNFRKEVLKRSHIDHNMPIIVYIDSYGGNVDALNSMLATIDQVSNPIVTVCLGKAMSAGAVLLAAGDHRFCSRMGRILIHEVSGGTIDPVNEMENNVKEARRLNNQMMNFLAKRCKKTYKEIKQIMHDQDSRDINLTPEKAKEFGIVDYIGMPMIKPLIMYTIETAPEHNYEASQTSSLEEALADAGIVEKKTGKKKTVRKSTRKKKTSKRNGKSRRNK